MLMRVEQRERKFPARNNSQDIATGLIAVAAAVAVADDRFAAV